LRRFIWGYAILVITAAVAELEPTQVPRAAEAKVVAIASPPGKCPSHFSSAEKRLSARPASTSTIPINTKNGISAQSNEATPPKRKILMAPKAELRPVVAQQPKKPTMKAEKAMGTPPNIRTKSKTRKITPKTKGSIPFSPLSSRGPDQIQRIRTRKKDVLKKRGLARF
jgi:hypothetical protein